MKRPKFVFAACLALVALVTSSPANETAAKPDEILAKLRSVNAYFMQKWPDPGKTIVTNKERPSNIWTRAVYYEGLMALHGIDPDPRFANYALRWAKHHEWGLRTGARTRNADDQCCGQTYIDLYLMDPKPERIHDIKANLDFIVAGDRNDDWWWIDALQMAMPVYAKLGALTKDAKYFDKAHQIYLYTKTQQGGKGLFNPADGLWWRDKDFVPPYKEPNGKNCYWARGNGWVVAALVRTLECLPADSPYRGEYAAMLKTMCEALVKVQRTDGFWNCSLHDPSNFGGKESSGTALFTYGMAWGVRNGVLDAATYQPVITKAWNALVHDAVHPNGFLGFVQGTGKEPKDGQPTTYNSVPDFEDYGIGCFLLAGVEIHKLVSKTTPAKP